MLFQISGNLKIFELIFGHILDKNPANKVGSTPLHVAAKEGYVSICKMIMKEKKENPKDKEGETPLHGAAENGHLDIYKLIIKNICGKSPKECKDRTVNPRDNTGLSPLHLAAINGHIEIYKFIFQMVDQKEPQNKDRRTPVELAANSAHCSVETFNIMLALGP